MTVTIRAALAALIAIFSTVLSSSAHAGVISSGSVFAGSPGLGAADVPIILTLLSDNDNPATGSTDNLVVPFKVFGQSNYIDIQFAVTPSTGVTEYKVVESVDNNTGTPWSSYQMVLGYGTGINFQPALAGDGLDFDFPDFNPAATTTAFPLIVPGEKTLTFSGGVQGSGAKSYSFRIDVPNLPQSANGSFTLRQIPTAIPEPATMALAACCGLAGLMLRRRG